MRNGHASADSFARLSALLCVAAAAAACDLSSPAQPPRWPPPMVIRPADPVPTPPPPIVQQVQLGQVIEGTFTGTDLAFELAAPVDGVLEARLTWDPWASDSLLVLKIGDVQFKPVPPAWSPVTGTQPVAAGGKYRLSVSGGGTDWFYNARFVLTTAVK